MKNQTVLDAFDWRLHWLYCDASRKEVQVMSDQEILDAVEAAQAGLSRLVWEYGTVTSTNDAMQEFVKLEGYARLHKRVLVLGNWLYELKEREAERYLKDCRTKLNAVSRQFKDPVPPDAAPACAVCGKPVGESVGNQRTADGRAVCDFCFVAESGI